MPPISTAISGSHSQLVGSCLPAVSLGSVLPCSSSSNSSSCSSLTDGTFTESRACAAKVTEKVIDDGTCQTRGDHHLRGEPSVMMTRQRAAALLKTKPDKSTMAAVKNCWNRKTHTQNKSQLGKQGQKNLAGKYSKPLTTSTAFRNCRSSLRLKNTLAASNQQELSNRAKVMNLFKGDNKSAKKTIADFKSLSGSSLGSVKPCNVVCFNSVLNEQKLTAAEDLKIVDINKEGSRVFIEQADDSFSDDSAPSDESTSDSSAELQPIDYESSMITGDVLVNENLEDAENDPENDGGAQQTAMSTAAVIAAEAVDEMMLMNSNSVTCQLNESVVDMSVNSDVMQNSSLPHHGSLVQGTGSLACAGEMPLLTSVRNAECSALLSPPSMVSPLSCITLVPALNSGLNLVQDAVHSSLYLSSSSSYLVKTNAIVYLKHSNSVQMSHLSTSLQMAPTTHHSLLTLSAAAQSLQDFVTLPPPAPIPQGVVALPATSIAHGVELLFPSPMLYETLNMPPTRGPHGLLTLSSVDPVLGIVTLSSNQATTNVAANMSPLVHVPASSTLVTLGPSPTPEGLLTIVPNPVLPSFSNLNLTAPLAMNNRSSLCVSVKNVDSFQSPYWSSSSQALGCEEPSSAVVCLVSNAVDSIASSPVVVENVRPTMSDCLKSCLVGSSSGMLKDATVALVGLNVHCALMLSQWDLSCPSARFKACASLNRSMYTVHADLLSAIVIVHALPVIVLLSLCSCGCCADLCHLLT